jgi:DNA-binding NtrC family response regulator
MARILVVDDDEGVGRLVRSVLQDAGHEVDVTNGPENAMQLCRSHAFDLVISDVEMPGPIDGHDLARWVAAEFPRCRVALMSGRPSDCDACPFIERCPMLLKPFAINELLEFVSETLNSRLEDRPNCNF